MPSRICHVSQKPSTAELILVSEGGGTEIEREVGGGGGGDILPVRVIPPEV